MQARHNASCKPADRPDVDRRRRQPPQASPTRSTAPLWLETAPDTSTPHSSNFAPVEDKW